MPPPAPAYLVVGDDPYLADEAVSEVTRGAGDLDVFEFPGEEGIGPALQAARTASMLGSRRFVVVRDADALPAADRKTLTDYLADPFDDTTLVLVASKRVGAIADAVGRVGRVVQVARGRRSELLSWLRGEMDARGLRPGRDAMEALIEAVGGERRALAGALDRLALSVSGDGRVEAAEVRLHFRSTAETPVYAFVDAVLAGQASKALVLLRKLIDGGESPQRLFWSLVGQVRMLLCADGPPAKIAEKLGLPAWRAELISRQARAFSREDLVSAYRGLAEADRAIKAGEVPEALAIERIVIGLARPAKPNRLR